MSTVNRNLNEVALKGMVRADLDSYAKELGLDESFVTGAQKGPLRAAILEAQAKLGASAAPVAAPADEDEEAEEDEVEEVVAQAEAAANGDVSATPEAAAAVVASATPAVAAAQTPDEEELAGTTTNPTPAGPPAAATGAVAPPNPFGANLPKPAGAPAAAKPAFPPMQAGEGFLKYAQRVNALQAAAGVSAGVPTAKATPGAPAGRPAQAKAAGPVLSQDIVTGDIKTVITELGDFYLTKHTAKATTAGTAVDPNEVFSDVARALNKAKRPLPGGATSRFWTGPLVTAAAI